MKFVINNQLGYFDISNNIWLQGSKNSMLHNLCLPLLTQGECIIDNVPQIKDIELNLSYLAELGAKIKWLSPTTVSIQCDNINNKLLSPALSRKTTGSKFFIPLMVNLFGEYKTGACGGCNIGDRQFEKYAQSLESFGIKHEKLDNEIYRFFQSELVVKEYELPFPSFGLTVNAILSSVWRTEDITINNACQEPEIDNTIEILRLMGKDIERVCPSVIEIRGGKELKACRFRNMSDRNAAVTYTVMALITRSNLKIENYDDVKMEAFYKFLDEIGAKYELQNRELFVIGKLSHPLKPIGISAFLYPEFHSDWQPLIAPLLTHIEGKSYLEEKLFSDRLRYWLELEKMGAKFKFDYGIETRFKDNNPHAVRINGKSNLSGAEVYARDLRGGVALVTASLVAKGKTVIHNAEEILRGYENLVDTLKRLSVNIEIED